MDNLCQCPSQHRGVNESVIVRLQHVTHSGAEVYDPLERHDVFIRHVTVCIPEAALHDIMVLVVLGF